MCNVLCVTSRILCTEPFLTRMERIAAARPAGIILREKDLPPSDLARLIAQLQRFCTRYGLPLALSGHADLARRCGCTAVQLSMPALRAGSPEQWRGLRTIGASVHSLAEAEEAVRLGAQRLIAGHIFPTACKPDLPPRGLDFLRRLCASTPLPVYAIGGVSPETAPALRTAGAAGACVMSALMTCPDPARWLERFRRAWREGNPSPDTAPASPCARFRCRESRK